MLAATYERYWMAPITNLWNVDGSTWLSLARVQGGDYESSEGCFMTLETSGEIWERCRDGSKALDGKAPFVISKYRPLPRSKDDLE